jgi:5,10-methylenetetrahydrofolate reductase
MKIVGTKLASLESSSQYESDDIDYVQYNQDFGAQFFQSQFVFKKRVSLIYWNGGSTTFFSRYLML